MSKWEPKEKRVEDIINAAVEVFLEKGYEGTSMEAIAHKAQISKGGLYHHFRSKEEILHYANEKLCEPISLFVQGALSNPDPVEGIKSYIRSYIEYWITHQKELTFFFLAMTKALSSRDMWVIYENFYNQISGFLRGLFEKGIAMGRFVEHDAAISSVTLLSALDGVLIYLVMNKELNSEDIILQFEEKFVSALLYH